MLLTTVQADICIGRGIVYYQWSIPYGKVGSELYHFLNFWVHSQLTGVMCMCLCVYVSVCYGWFFFFWRLDWVNHQFVAHFHPGPIGPPIGWVSFFSLFFAFIPKGNSWILVYHWLDIHPYKMISIVLCVYILKFHKLNGAIFNPSFLCSEHCLGNLLTFLGIVVFCCF